MSQTLKAQNKVLEDKVHFLEKKIDKSTIEHEHQIGYLRELSERKQAPTEFELAKKNKNIKFLPLESFSIRSPTSSASSTLFSQSQSMEKPLLDQLNSGQDMKDLKEEIKELKNNQSTLLDKLAERDKIIEDL